MGATDAADLAAVAIVSPPSFPRCNASTPIMIWGPLPSSAALHGRPSLGSRAHQTIDPHGDFTVRQVPPPSSGHMMHPRGCSVFFKPPSLCNCTHSCKHNMSCCCALRLVQGCSFSAVKRMTDLRFGWKNDQFRLALTSLYMSILRAQQYSGVAIPSACADGIVV
jgi:hypothetical protein